MTPLKSFSLVGATCLALSAPAQAQLGGIVTGNDVDRIAELASAYGTAERRFDDIEDGPWIRAEMDEVIYTISFLNCTDGQQCTSAQFRAWWTSEGAHTIEAMNQWNRDRRFSKAYLDANDNATIEFDVNLAGGVTAVNFDDTLQWWQAVLNEFLADVIDPGYAAMPGSGGNDSAPPPLTK